MMKVLALHVGEVPQSLLAASNMGSGSMGGPALSRRSGTLLAVAAHRPWGAP